MSGTFVGREVDLDVLHRALADVVPLRVLILDGEAGIGKSALVDAFLAMHGLRASTCRFAVGESGIGRVAAAFNTQPPTGATGQRRLSTLETGIVLRHHAIGELAERLVDGLAAATDGNPVFVFEDLHFADEIELELLQTTLFSLADRHLDLPALVVCTTRPVESTNQVADFVDRITRPSWSTLHRMGPLAFDEVAEVLRLEGADANPVTVVAPIHEVTGGNALHVRMLAREIQAGQRIPTTLPSVLSAAVGAWVSRLSPQTRDILAAGALFGEELREDQLGAVADAPANVVNRAVGEALERDVLVERGDTLAYSHALIRGEFMSKVPRSERALVRLRCAKVAERDPGLSIGNRALARARHLRAAGDAAPAPERYSALLTAGHAAFDSFHWATAAGFFSDAILLGHSMGIVNGAPPGVRLRCGRAHERAYSNREAMSLYESVLEDDGATDEDRFNAAFWMVHLDTTRPGSSDRARPDVAVLEPYVDDDGDVDRRTLAILLHAESALSLGEIDEAARYMTQARASAEGGVSADIRARVDWTAGLTEMHRLATGLGSTALTNARLEADRGGDLLISCWTRNRLAHAAWASGRCKEAAKLAVDAAERSEPIHLLGELAYALAVQGGASAAVGDFRDAELLANKAIRYFEHSEFSQVQYLAYPVKLWMHHHLGDGDAMSADLSRWLTHEPHGSGRYVRLGEPIAPETADSYRSGRRLTMTSAGMILLDAYNARQGPSIAVDDVVADLQRLIEADLVLPSGWPSLPQRICAELLLRDERPAPATEFAMDAVELARQNTLYPELAASLVAATECLALTGHTDDARRAAAEAMAISDRLGLRPAYEASRMWGLRLSTGAQDPPAESSFRVVLVTDVVGSTALSVKRGDETYFVAMNHHLEIAADASASHGGHVFDTAGDSLLAWFSSVAEAEAAALSILADATARHADPRHDMGIRVGLATGFPFERDQRVYGATVILAARACSEARPNTIYATADLVQRSGLDYEDEGPHFLKGFPGRPRLFSLS